ncbi:MAG TPA: hypothetical protein VK324_14345 [Tepidisphaeraceae bacterium]|nr:hypothetical protein [Tepidisphaeraceae bacterium]
MGQLLFENIYFHATRAKAWYRVAFAGAPTDNGAPRGVAGSPAAA